MKNFFTLLFGIILINGFAQAPVMNPITGPTVACSSPSSPMSFTASASNSPTSYSWSVASPSTGVIINNPSGAVTSISFPYTNGTYTLYCSATNGFGTSATESFVVTVFETPSVSFSGSNTFCQGSATYLSASSTILAASPTIFYNWAPNFYLNTTVGPNVWANPNVQTTYTVTAIKGACSNTAQITVTPLISPTVTASATNSVGCFGYSTILSAIGANTYSWSNGVTNNVSFIPPFTNLYNVVGTASNGCTNTQYVLITVHPLPTLTVSSTATMLCEGQSAALSINGNAQSYSLNANPTATSIVISPTTTTSYTIDAYTSFGCHSSQIFTQIVANCTGLNTTLAENNYLNLYPNPNNGLFYIKSNLKKTVHIINQLGETIRTIELNPETEYTISGLSAGIYLIQTSTTRSKVIVTN